MNLRKFIFYTADYIKGCPIGKHLNDLSSVLKNTRAPENLNLQNNRLNNVIGHAKSRVRYYRERCSGANTLSDFPIVNKLIIKEKIDEFIVDGVKKEKLTKVVTSGSTGTPFVVYHDSDKRNRNTADTIHFGKQAGFEVGYQLVYLKIWNTVNRKSRWLLWKQNTKPVDVTHLSDRELREIVFYLADNQSKKVLLGYSSALEALVKLVDQDFENKVFRNVKAIIAMSEALSSPTKHLLKKYFEIYPVSRYSNVENGILAQQLPDGQNDFVINWASYFIEIVDLDEDKPVPYGTLGRIVVTDLFNFSMPMIRYDTGDTGIIDWSDDQKDLVLKLVEGRRMDLVFDTKGQIVSSFTITNNMWLYPEIIQYQFLQIGPKEYKFVLNVPQPFLREGYLIDEFKKYFGLDSVISVEYVNEVPLLMSGKRKKVRNLWKSNV